MGSPATAARDAREYVLVAIPDELLLRTVSWFLKEHGYVTLEAFLAGKPVILARSILTRITSELLPVRQPALV